MAKDLIINRETGELSPFEEPTYIFDDDRGRIPDWEKDTLDGQTVKIFGISEEAEEFSLGTVRFVKLLRQEDDPTAEPWGLLISAGSPMVSQVDGMVRRGLTPFIATIERVPSQTKGHSPYWKLRKPQA